MQDTSEMEKAHLGLLPRIAIHTLGCRLNQYESDGILQTFLDTGRYIETSIDDGPDIAVINSCTVTDQADRRSLKIVRKLKKSNNDCKVIFTGCLAQTDSEMLSKIEGIHLVIGNDFKSKLLEIIENDFSKKNHVLEISKSKLIGYADRPTLYQPFSYGKVIPKGHVRAYMKIQDGCNRKCSYCKIPIARGEGVSRPSKDILDHLKKLEDQGVPEVVITGVNLGWYRDRSRDSLKQNNYRFLQLLESMLETLQNMRLRISSIEPCDVNAQLGELSTHPLFCDYLHVPLQSGSGHILKSMRRTYNPQSFLKRIEAVRKYNPKLFLGTDVIVGFPGEDQAAFQDTINVCRESQVAGIHGFRFSTRSGTPAATAKGQISITVMKSRMQELMELRDQLQSNYRALFIGKKRKAILEKLTPANPQLNKTSYAELLSDNFLRVSVPFSEACKHVRGDLLEVQFLKDLPGRTMQGVLSL